MRVRIRKCSDRPSLGVRLAFAQIVLLAILFRAQAATGSGGAAVQTGEASVDEAVLFAFDDHSIPFTDNLQLSLEAPEKYSGNPVLPSGQPGEPDEWQLRYYCSIVRHDGKFKIWYLAMAKEAFVTPLQGGPFADQGMRYAYAESADGLHWTKPDLGLVEFRGSRHNNLIQMPDGFFGYGANVRYEPDERDPSRRFKMMALQTRFGDYSVPGLPAGGHAFIPMYSPDGLRWRVADELVAEDKRVISPKFHLVMNHEGMGLYRWKGMYYVAVQGGPKAAMAPYGRHVQILRSPDFLHWSETQTMGFARQGQFRRPSRSNGLDNNEQAHVGVSVWNRGNVLLGITGFFHGAKDWNDVTHDLGFLISNDGLHFREPQPEFLIARVGQDGRDWDQGGLLHGQGSMENVGEQTYIWYAQMAERDYGPRDGRPSLRGGGVGVLMLARDRFGSLSTRDPERDGTLITSELTTSQPVKIWFNAEGLGPKSSLRIELLDESERPLSGYSGRDAAILERSGLRVPAAWKQGELIAPRAEPFKIRVRLEGLERNAIRLYALYIGR